MESRKQKTLITGSEGFIGSHLKKAIPNADCLDLKLGQDLRTYKFTKEYDIIYHVAANASIPDSFANPIESHSHNVLVTLRILEYARKTGAKVIFSSSSSIYGEAPTPTTENEIPRPVSPYAIQKLECELYLKFYWSLGVKSVALRYFNVYGEGQEMANGGDSLALAKFLSQYREGKPFTIIGTGEQRRDFVYVGDVVRANMLAAKFLDTTDRFHVFNIGKGKNYTINSVLNMIKRDHPRIHLPPRPEPFVGLADTRKSNVILGWESKTSLSNWIKKQL